MELKKRILQTLLDLVSIPGISGTKSENLASQRIYEILSGITYFRNNPEDLRTVKIENDPLERSFIYALLRSKQPSDKTLILTGHFDVVGIDEFGHLKDFAFDAVKYTEKVSELSLDDEALKDLKSGDWLFGRGTSDMKYGIALFIELLRDFSERDDFIGNILFLAVPGEESNSEGMLGAVPFLAELQESYGLKYAGVFVSECCLPEHPGDETKRLYTGTCGKVMPLFFFAGKESHVCEPFKGVNPNLLASEVNRLLELNTDFCYMHGKDITPAPVCLKQTDLKDIYSVQTPLYAASYYNVLTLKLNADELICRLRELCTHAFESAVDIIRRNKALYEEASGRHTAFDISPEVLTFEELYKKVKDIYGGEIDDYINIRISEWLEKGIDIQTITILAIKEIYEKFPDKKPMIVIAFAPPYYPDKYTDMNSSCHKDFTEAINRLIHFARENFSIEIEKKNFFMGICDLSYTGFSEGKTADTISSSMPPLGKAYMLPVESLKKLDIPGAVFGGFGKDFHKYTERLNLSYSLDVVPKLYEFAVLDILNNLQAD